MNYLHQPYQYVAHPGIPMDQPMSFDPTMGHPAMMHPMDGGYLYQHPPFDMVDFYPIMDYEEYAENLSRPRLTKEQVETLEAQFQAHPKPSSNVKRQLAAQTNLSLPRVANWFQNRRAKAKQQKRQEEFERMQKAKAEAEEAARGKSESEPNAESNSDAKPSTDNKTDKVTPQQSSGTDTTEDQSKTAASASSSRSKHKKTRSESAREATFASLQRALNAAVAARDHNSPDNEHRPAGNPNADGSISPATPFLDTHAPSHHYADAQSAQSALNTPYPEWDHSKHWAPSQSPAESLGSQHTHNVMPSVQFPSSQGEEWAGQVQPTDNSFHTMQYPVQPEMALSKRGSSEELASTLEGIGIHTTGSNGLSHLSTGPERPTWRETGKELDLAARRKRPRPAAIGTSRSSSMLAGSSSMSPTTRVPSYGTSHGVRQSKSTQCLNSRYAGVRKASAAQRSPLNLSNFAEAGAFGSKAEMSMLQPAVTTGALAPPTPLTPEDLHHLLPNTPTDGGYCLSAQPTSGLFPTTQPMQINIASPPATPLGVDLMSSYSYNNVAPPMSAPAHYTSFPEYVNCDSATMTGRSWTDATSMPSPEASFQSRCPMPQQADGSMSYERSVDTVPISESPSLVYSTSEGELSVHADSKGMEFCIQEFPEQQEAHRFVAQQMSQKPKAYTFNNQTPNDF
ncbi:homeobox transcription factor [Aspergillus terreus]|uniref:Homeobox transcription factor n=1 Tax=Aspergillus terreus TaxID=33178 RepID=A0A5M3YSN1_ASPTE|nr:hypothetical protein ATETN484_0003019000 [Aspergillus terreus]GFF14198.1 homeobox transcription factor [Aspergillus terreus]